MREGNGKNDGMESMIRSALGVKKSEKVSVDVPSKRIPTPGEMAKSANLKTPRVTKNGRMDE